MSAKKAAKTEHLQPREWLLRFEEHTEGSAEEGTARTCLRLHKLLIHSKTPCGVWVYPNEHPQYGSKLRFILMQTHSSYKTIKRYAHYDEAEALQSYIRRKQMQLHHLEMQTKRAQIGLRMAEARTNG